ncbi:MAG: class I SAM-dependent methyltransferase [Verrucomicrobia bacterium]|nr:class I SAM-dependent methyltransferase [Verrucomicrobiota bacterium]MBI3870682.1 class I SAM-dependent methyltransferase [Verrucomicrobiota bacterium]
MLKALKEMFYGWRQQRHLEMSVGRLRELESSVQDPRDRWNVPFRYRGCGFFKRIRPMQSEREIHGLFEAVSAQKPRAVMEIGTCHGGTLYMWCQAAHPNALLISLDLPSGEFGGGYRDCRAPLYNAFKRPSQHLHLVRADSHDPSNVSRIRELLGGVSLDFLFIDGDHTYEGVKTDFELYSPLVAPGGLVALHDIVKRSDQPRIEVWRFWDELKQSARVAGEWIESDPNRRSIGIGAIEIPS